MPDEPLNDDVLQRAQGVAQEFQPYIQGPKQLGQPDETDAAHPVAKFFDAARMEHERWKSGLQHVDSPYLGGDEGVRRFASEHADKYGAALREKVPEFGEDRIKRLQTGFQDQAFAAGRAWQLHQEATSQATTQGVNVAKAGLAGVFMPLRTASGIIQGPPQAERQKQFNAETANEDHYAAQGQEIAADVARQRSGWWGKFAEKTAGVAGEAPWTYLGLKGSSALLGAAGIAAPAAGAGLGARTAYGAAQGSGLAAITAPQIVPAAQQRIAAGEDPTSAYWKETGAHLISNVALGTALGSGKPGAGLGHMLTTNAVKLPLYSTVASAVEDASGLRKGNLGNLWRAIESKDPDAVSKAWEEVSTDAASQAAGGMLLSAMDAIGQAHQAAEAQGKTLDPAKTAQEVLRSLAEGTFRPEADDVRNAENARAHALAQARSAGEAAGLVAPAEAAQGGSGEAAPAGGENLAGARDQAAEPGQIRGPLAEEAGNNQARAGAQERGAVSTQPITRAVGDQGSPEAAGAGGEPGGLPGRADNAAAAGSAASGGGVLGTVPRETTVAERMQQERAAKGPQRNRELAQFEAELRKTVDPESPAYEKAVRDKMEELGIGQEDVSGRASLGRTARMAQAAGGGAEEDYARVPGFRGRTSKPKPPTPTPQPAATPAGTPPQGTLAHIGGKMWRWLAGGRTSAEQWKQTAQDLLDEHNAREARSNEIARVRLDKASKFFSTYLEAAPDEPTRLQRLLELTDAAQSGNLGSLRPELQEAMKPITELWDSLEPELLQRGILKQTEENHLKQSWKDRQNPNAAPEEILARLLARRPLAGPEGFKHAKTHDTFRAGIDSGLEPSTWNLADMQRAGLSEGYRSIKAHDLIEALREKGGWKYVPNGRRAPVDTRFVDDASAKVFAPPEAKVHEFYDEGQWNALMDVAQKLGIDVKTTMTGHPGLARRGGGVERRFATPNEVLAHEIGHQLDYRYGLENQWVKQGAGPIKQELRDLADLRFAGKQTTQAFKDYARKGTEKIANLIEAYLHAPELLHSIAPHAERALDNFISAHPELHGLRDVKPSLVLGEREALLRLAGPMAVGRYAAPNPVADVIENFTRTGLRGNAVYDAARRGNNFLNMIQLAVPSFHAMGSTMQAHISRMAELVQRLSRLPYQVATGEAGKGFAGTGRALLGAAVPGWAAGEQIKSGRAQGKEYYKPGSQSPDIAQIVEDTLMGGGRARMDPYYGGTALQNFTKAVRQLQTAAKQGGSAVTKEAAWKAITNATEALPEAIAKPVLDALVPVLKRGAAAQMMAYERERLGPNATNDQLRESFGRVMDSIDNRFGELNYDNTHMPRLAKDALMLAFRSLGWNLGTWRELGGGVKDIPMSVRGLFNGEGISPRTAYTIALPLVTALYGAGLMKLMTGLWPDDSKDAMFPRTGKKNKDGTDERLAMPTYMRDVGGAFNRFEEGPFRVIRNLADMAGNKASPLINPFNDFRKNEDYFGKAVYDPKSSQWQQAKDVGKHFVGTVEPFMSRNIRQQLESGQSTEKSLLPLIGVTTAPAYIRRTTEEQQAREEKGHFQRSPVEKLRRQKAGLR